MKTQTITTHESNTITVTAGRNVLHLNREAIEELALAVTDNNNLKDLIFKSLTDAISMAKEEEYNVHEIKNVTYALTLFYDIFNQNGTY